MAFSHLRESIKVADTIRRSRPGSILSSKSRRGSVDRIDAHDPMGLTPLVSHIRAGEHAKAEWAMDNGADAEVKCNGKTALLHAVERGDTSMLHILWDYQPTLDLEARDLDGKTALAIAAERGDPLMIDTLMNLGANIESTTPESETPIMIAAQYGQLSAVEALIRHGANCESKNQEGWSTLHYAVHGPNRPEVQLIIQYLIHAGAKVDCLSRGESPLHKATMDQKTFALKTLLENNANLLLKLGKSGDCLHIAVKKNYLDVATILVDIGGAMWEEKIPSDAKPKMKNLLKRSSSDMPPPSRKFSNDSGISMSPTERSHRSRLSSILG
jgi:ankyrin repeat protein